MIPTLPMKKLRHREVNLLAHKHTESKGLSWDSPPKKLASGTILTPFCYDLTSTTYLAFPLPGTLCLLNIIDELEIEPRFQCRPIWPPNSWNIQAPKRIVTFQETPGNPTQVPLPADTFPSTPAYTCLTFLGTHATHSTCVFSVWVP